MSQFAEERRGTLDEVKADAEAITKARLLADNPDLEDHAQARRDRFAVERGDKAAPEVEPTQPLPGESDGQPDQGAIEEPKSTKKGGKK